MLDNWHTYAAKYGAFAGFQQPIQVFREYIRTELSNIYTQYIVEYASQLLDGIHGQGN